MISSLCHLSINGWWGRWNYLPAILVHITFWWVELWCEVFYNYIYGDAYIGNKTLFCQYVFLTIHQWIIKLVRVSDRFHNVWSHKAVYTSQYFHQDFVINGLNRSKLCILLNIVAIIYINVSVIFYLSIYILFSIIVISSFIFGFLNK